MVIAIDGTASSGKSSVSKELAKRLGFPLLGTGAVYRAIAHKALFMNIEPDDDAALAQMLESTEIESVSNAGGSTVYVDKMPVPESRLNSPEVGHVVASYAVKDFIRVFVRSIQHKAARDNENIIVEGRDIGSVVFPDADIKFFIDADLETRAKRRYEDFLRQGKNISLDEVIRELQTRDEQDKHRNLSPLIMTSDAILIDSSDLTIAQVVDELVEKINSKKENNV